MTKLPRSKDHIHQYEKVKWGAKQTVIWKCMLPDCSHYLHVEFIMGKLCRCFKCGRTFEMTTAKLLRKRPKCDDCQHKSGQGVKGKREDKVSIPDLSNIDINDLLENL